MFPKTNAYFDKKREDSLTQLLQTEEKCHAHVSTLSTVNNVNVTYKDVNDFRTIPLSDVHCYLKTTVY